MKIWLKQGGRDKVEAAGELRVVRACSILAQIILQRGCSKNFKAILRNFEMEWVPKTHLLAPVVPYRDWAPYDSS